MEDKRLTASELARRRRLLEQLAQQWASAAASGTAQDRTGQTHWQMFDLSTAAGRQIYASFSDGALLSLLRHRGEVLGRSPAQPEVFWVYRAYLRERFGKWPYALERAGLGKSAGRGGQTLDQAAAARNETAVLLEQVRHKTLELGRTPHPKDLPQVCTAFRRTYKTWGEVLEAAGVAQTQSELVTTISDLEPQYQAMLEEIRVLSETLGRAPQRREVPDATRTALTARCGSWRNTLYQLGLEPVQHITPFSTAYLTKPDGPKKHHRGTLHDCYYRVLHPDQETITLLDSLRQQALASGQVPDRKAVPQAVRRQLQQSCGSWANALFQVGLHKGIPDDSTKH